MYILENVGQGHRVQNCKWFDLIVNVDKHQHYAILRETLTV